MELPNPNISVYKHGSKDDYLFLRHAPRGRWFGDFMHVSAEDLCAKGLDLILGDLKEFRSRDPEHGCVLDGFSPKAKKARKLLKEYDEVLVQLESESLISLNPVCVTGRARESGVVRKVDVELIPLPCSNGAFFQRLVQAFDKCCYVANV